MPVRRTIPYKNGLFFFTFTCHNWLPLIDITNGYNLVYKWFNYLKSCGHHVAGYVIMPNHIHVMIQFSKTSKSINTIIGDGKRFMAYSIIQRLEEKNETALLNRLQVDVSAKDKRNHKKHEVWEESFDWKYCETMKFTMQKLNYIHSNPCKGKWKLAKDEMAYEHSSARYYISGRHAGYEVVDVEGILRPEYDDIDPESP